jgi:CRISPR-associated endonuclease/helicase Cas3
MAGPLLVIIETPMASGKTEAALAIADILIRERGAGGIYYALPTQATGDQMFRRVAEFLRSHPARIDDDVELHLLHSRSDLNPNYADLKPSALYDSDGNREPAVVASSWFKARKRGLISPCAVGTLDQALMAAMQVRYMFVRLFGLSGKVVIIDEVHAYDIYTSEIPYSLLRWLGALGTPVVLLSATLPAHRRNMLIRAYAPRIQMLPPISYPSVLAVSRDDSAVLAQKVEEIDRRALSLTAVTVKYSERFDTTADLLEADLAQGGTAACFVNTVDDAQTLYQYLRRNLSFSGDTEFILFHARFPANRRLEIEQRVDRLFGKGPDERPNPERPRRAVVVATQVLEQSLDVDFDVMVTDIAPIDFVLQGCI